MKPCLPLSFILIGVVYLNYNPVVTLFDSGSTHMFMLRNHAELLQLHIFELGYSLDVSTPRGKVYTTMVMTNRMTINIQGHQLGMEFILLDRQDFDLIIGMDWPLSQHPMLACR